MDKVLNHIDYIISLAGLEGHRLTTTRIVKFLYLLEVLYVKHSKNRLTDWNWLFWDFGPYCIESLQALKIAQERNLIVSENFQSKFDEESEYVLFDYPRDQYLYQNDLEKHVEELEKDIPIMIKMGMRGYIKKYGNNTDDLLDFVYFQTGPMKKAMPRKSLDFSMISQGFDETVKPVRLSRNKEKKVQRAIKKMKDKMLKEKNINLIIPAQHIDFDYIQGMKILNGMDENENIKEIGYASIKSITRS